MFGTDPWQSVKVPALEYVVLTQFVKRARYSCVAGNAAAKVNTDVTGLLDKGDVVYVYRALLSSDTHTSPWNSSQPTDVSCC